MVYKLKNVGGAQLYWYYKSEWLKSNGYDVLFYHYTSSNENILIDGLKQYAKYHDERLEQPPYVYNRKVRESVISRLLSGIYIKYDEYFVESSTFECSAWGELLAKKLQGKHIAFYLMEELILPNDGYFNFIQFKYKRREVAGINNKVLKKLYANYGIQLEPEQSYSIKAYEGDPIQAIPYSNISDIPHSDYTIGMLTRLEKGFVKEVLSSIRQFAKNNIDKTFTLLVIGDSQNPEVRQKVEHFYDDLGNVKVYITGFLIPVPISLVSLADMFISTAGAACRTMVKGKLTVTYDAIDLKPIGILGLTTNSHTIREKNEPPLDMLQLMDDILIKKKYTEEMLVASHPYINVEVDYGSHIDFINQSNKDKDYYDVTTIHCNRNEKIKRFIFISFGFNIGSVLISFLNRLRGVTG